MCDICHPDSLVPRRDYGNAEECGGSNPLCTGVPPATLALGHCSDTDDTEGGNVSDPELPNNRFSLQNFGAAMVSRMFVLSSFCFDLGRWRNFSGVLASRKYRRLGEPFHYCCGGGASAACVFTARVRGV